MRGLKISLMSIQVTLNHVKIYFGSEIFIDALLTYLEYIGLNFLLLFKTAQSLINILWFFMSNMEIQSMKISISSLLLWPAKGENLGAFAFFVRKYWEYLFPHPGGGSDHQIGVAGNRWRCDSLEISNSLLLGGMSTMETSKWKKKFFFCKIEKKKYF